MAAAALLLWLISQENVLQLSSDGDKDLFLGVLGGSGADPLTCMSSYSVDRWNGNFQIICNSRRMVFYISTATPPSVGREASFWKHSFLLSIYTRRHRLLKVQSVLWAFVSCWDNMGLISCLAGTNNSLGEMLQGLINNIAVIKYILISKWIPAEKQIWPCPSRLECKHPNTYAYTLIHLYTYTVHLYTFTLPNLHNIN